MTTETFRRADHRPVPTSAHEAEASAVALRAPSEASASCCFPLDITHSPSRRRLSKEIVGRGIAEYEAKYPKAAACLATDRGGAPDLLRLSGRTLDSSPDHERHRIAVRHGPACGNGSPRGQAPAPRAY